MTIKPFAIQGADLTLGGVNLQAGTSGVVIPGVTQATNYTVEEVQDTGDQTHQFTPNGEVVVVDYVLYNVIVAQGNEGLYADYTATTDGEGYIDNIKVNGQGTYTSQEAADNAANDMYAYIGSASASDRPLVPEDWITIPFRPKMRAGAIENIGGGNANTGNFTFNEDTITNGNGLILATDRGTLAIGSQLETPGVAGHLHIAFNNSNVNPPASDLFLGDDYNYVKLPGYYLNTATQYGIELGTNDRNGGGSNNWRFGTDGVLTLPDGNTRIGNINGIDSIVASTGTGFAVFAQGTGGFNVLQWVADTGSLGSTGTQVAAVIVNSPLASTSGTVQIATGLAYGFTVDNIWTFGTDGSITFPNNTVQTTAYTGDSNLNNWLLDIVTANTATGFVAAISAVEYDTLGNVLAIGFRSDGGPGSAVTVMKFDTQGNLIWQNLFADNVSVDGFGLAVDNNNDAIISGQYDNKLFLLKVSGANGGGIWGTAVASASTSTTESVGLTVDVDNLNNIIVAGYVTDTTNNSYNDDFIVAKFSNTDGSNIWARKLGDAFFDQDSYGLGVGALNQNEIVVVGYNEHYIGGTVTGVSLVEPTSNPAWTGTDIIVVLPDNNNHGLEVRASFTDGVPSFTIVNGAIGWAASNTVTVDGALIGGASGTDNMSLRFSVDQIYSNNNQALIAKYDNAGVLQWQREFSVAGSNYSGGADADIDSTGNVYLAGNYGDNTSTWGIVAQFSPIGDLNWSRQIGLGSCFAGNSSIVVGSDNIVYVGGMASVGPPNNIVDANVFLGAYDATGTVQWQRTYGNPDRVETVGAIFNNSGASNFDVQGDYLVFGGGNYNNFIRDNSYPSDLRGFLFQIDKSGAEQIWGTTTLAPSYLPEAAVTLTVTTSTLPDVAWAITQTPAEPSFQPDSLAITKTFGLLGGGAGGELVNGGYTITLDSNGILQMPPGNETTAGWIQWSHAGNDLTNIAGAGFVDYYDVYTGLGLSSPTDTNAAKGIWFGTPTDPTSPFQPETSMVFRGDTLYLPKNGYIKSHDIDYNGYPAIGTTGTSITIQTAETTSTQNNWTFSSAGTLTLPQGSTIGETSSTTIITPPGASAGQSLVIRPTGVGFSITTDHPGGFVPGENLVITVANQNALGAGTVDYEFTGATSQQLGHATSGTLTYSSSTTATTVICEIPANSSMTTFTFTLVSATGFVEQGGPQGLPTSVTVTLDSVTFTENSHIHLVTGNPTTVDLYLGDDDQYVKIEKNHGDVVIGTNTNTNHWRFGTDGSLKFPDDTVQTTAWRGLSNAGDQTLGGRLYLNGKKVSDGPYEANSIEMGSSLGLSAVRGIGGPSGGIVLQTAAGYTVEHIWQFGYDGNLTFPDNTVQTTAYIDNTPPALAGLLSTATTIAITAATAQGGPSASVDVTITNHQVDHYGSTAYTGNVLSTGLVVIPDTTQSPPIAYTILQVGSQSLTQSYSLGASGSPAYSHYIAYAYVVTAFGTVWSAPTSGQFGSVCLIAGTMILLSDGTRKAIEDITYTDKLQSWNFDQGCYAETTALWIKQAETGYQYNLLTFSDGTTLRTFDQHRIFNKEAGAFTYPMTDATPIGTTTVNEHGQEITLVDKQVIQDTIEYYNVITDYHMNLFSDTILTSCRFNNIYPVTDMKFVKDDRTPRTRDEFANIPDRFFYGLRLAEQTTDIETVEWYVTRLLALEESFEAVAV